MHLDTPTIESFQRYIWSFYATHKRVFPWRYVDDPYKILVSEVMLQQTQTYRVEPKYTQFIAAFPTLQALAEAPWQSVMGAWQGLGYNRRAQRLHKLAQLIMHDYQGVLPLTPDELVMLPGIGAATASSIAAFAYNMPTVFVETNIRTVFVYHFFAQEESVHDKQVLPLIEATLDHHNARSWYYALMDYGVYIKKHCYNANKKSKHYTRQSSFEGSDRQIRGAVLKILVTKPNTSYREMCQMADIDPVRLHAILDQLCVESLIRKIKGRFSL